MTNALVVGSGLAGLVAARALAMDGGHRPLVLEAAGRPGGKAASWRIAGGGLVEMGLHVCFPHDTALLGLLDALGRADAVAWGGPLLSYVHDGGTVAALRFPPLPAPLHSAVALARHRHLPLVDRRSAVAGALEATMTGAGWHARYENVSFARWARRRGLSARALAELLEPVVRGLTFLPSDRVSARAVLGYIHAVARRPGGCRVGAFRGGSGEALVAPLAADLQRRGGEVRLESPVQEIVLRDGRVQGVRLADGSEIASPLVIAAVPCHALPDLLPELARRNPALAGACRLRPVPVASAMLWFDRDVGGPPGVQLSPHCVFNTWVDMAGLLPELADRRRSVLQLVIAPMTAFADLDDAALLALLLADLRRVLPAVRAARLEQSVITRVPRAFHAMLPGADALRPPVDIGVPGLRLAGDYVLQGRSPNMETAIVSGQLAARSAQAAAP